MHRETFIKQNVMTTPTYTTCIDICLPYMTWFWKANFEKHTNNLQLFI